METYTREEMEEMVHFMKQQSKQLTTSFQLPGMAPGVMTGGRLQGISRGAKLDAIGMGEIEIATGIIEDSYTGQTVKKIGRKTRQETDIQDLEGQIEILPGLGVRIGEGVQDWLHRFTRVAKRQSDRGAKPFCLSVPQRGTRKRGNFSDTRQPTQDRKEQREKEAESQQSRSGGEESAQGR